MREIKKLAFLCLLLFVFTTLIVAFHHHEDGEEHEDCLICAAAAHCTLITETQTFLPQIIQEVTTVAVAQEKEPPAPFGKTLPGRSPPSIS